MRKARPSRHIVRSLVAAAIASASLDLSIAHGTTFYWDSNGTAAGVGGNGSTINWNLADWTTDPTGASPTVVWPNTSPNADTSVFTTSAGTINIDPGINVNSMVFQAANYVIGPFGSNYLNLSGTSPTIGVDLPIVSGQTIVTISAPITGSSGFTLDGNNDLGGGLKFLQLANTSTININNFSGPLVINAAGAMRLGGGSLTEQIGDSVDLTVYGVLDFVTSGSAANGKNEKIRDLTVSGAANFSVGNGARFIVNSATVSNTGTSPGIALNGNTATVQPSTLDVSGWSDGNALLSLNDGTLRMNATGGNGQLGSAVNLWGNISGSGNSFIWNQNGGGAGTATTNSFTNHHLNFKVGASTIDVATDGTLTLSSASASQPIMLTSPAAGISLVKTGGGTLAFINAMEYDGVFNGTNEVREGTWLVGPNSSLATKASLLVSGGTLILQPAFQETSKVTLTGGTIIIANGTIANSLGTTGSFDLCSGFIGGSLSGGAVQLVKTTPGTVYLQGTETYTGSTLVYGGTLSLQGRVTSPTLIVNAGTMVLEGWDQPNDPRGANRFSTFSITSGGTVDLKNNAMVMDYSSSVGLLLNLIRTDLHTGRVISSIHAPGHAIGYGDNQLLQVGTFAGLDVSGHNNVLLKYTYEGDANLDGQVDISDLYALASSWQGFGPWTSGDFNYDGLVNAADLGLLASNWQAGVGNPLPGSALEDALLALHPPDVSSTPEPAGTLLLGVLTTWSLKRPRRARTRR